METSSEILVHIVMRASRSCCRLSATHPWCESPVPPHPIMVYWIEIWWLWRPRVKWTHCHVQETSLRWFELCDMVHYPAGSSIRRSVHCSHKGMTWSATILDLVFKRCSIGTKGPKVCQENIPHTNLHTTTTSLNCWDKAGWIHAFMFFTPNYMTLPSEPSDQATFTSFYCPVLVSLCEFYPLCPVLSWQERHPVWSSAAVVHLLQGSTCLCVQRWYSA